MIPKKSATPTSDIADFNDSLKTFEISNKKPIIPMNPSTAPVKLVINSLPKNVGFKYNNIEQRKKAKATDIPSVIFILSSILYPPNYFYS